MKGKYKTVKWADIEENQKYLVFYKKGWNGGSDLVHFLNGKQIQYLVNKDGILFDTLEFKRIIKFDEYMTERLEPYFKSVGEIYE